MQEQITIIYVLSMLQRTQNDLNVYTIEKKGISRGTLMYRSMRTSSATTESMKSFQIHLVGHESCIPIALFLT